MPRGQVFVGRSSELERLAALAVNPASGRPAAGLVVGEPGLGKTRLLAEVTRGLRPPPVALHGYELARDVPFSAAAGLLRRLSAAPKAGPRLDALLVGAGDRPARSLESLRLSEAAFRCLTEIGPVWVVLDDVQWADTQSLSLLQYLLAAAGPAQVPLLLLGASRPAPQAHAFAADLHRLLGPDGLVEIALGPLDRAEGIALAAQLTPGLDEAAAERLWQQAQGSPFWLQALAGQDHPPASPARLVRSRLSGLADDAGQLFALLVVSTQPLTVRDLLELTGWSEQRARPAVAELVNRALVAQEAGTVRVSHDLLREAAGAELPDAEQRRLHRRLASWLQDSAGEDIRQLFRALQHRQAAGGAAAELASRIARSPQRRLLGAAGLAALGAIADADPDGDALQLDVARLAAELGEWAVALERWSALADRLPQPEARADAALAAAAAAFRLGRAEQVHSLLTQARANAAADPVLAVEADAQEAQALLWLENQPVRAQPVVDRAAAAAQRLVERAGGVAALSGQESRAYVRALRARLDAAIRQAEADTVALCAELIQTGARDPAEALAAASDGVFSLLQFEGLPRAAEPRARRLLEESRQRVLPSIEVEATHWVGWIAHHLGRLDEAGELLDQAVELASRVGAPRRFTVAQLRAVACSIAASRGDWRENVTQIERAITAEPDPHYRLVIRLLHVWLVGRFAAPSPAQLAPVLAAMAADAEAAGCGRCRWEAVLHGAEAQARIGDVAGAQAALRGWDEAHQRPHGGPAARRGYVQALLQMHGDAAASLPLFAQAAVDAAGVGHELMRLWITLDAAEAAARVDRAEGIEQLRRAAAQAGEMGARSEQQLAVHRLRALGVRTWRRTGDAAPLTARELEIARLVVAGQSNPEIASALFLSRKTVERHVSNILVKCQARNRTELAHRLATLPPAGADGGAPR